MASKMIVAFCAAAMIATVAGQNCGCSCNSGSQVNYGLSENNVAEISGSNIGLSAGNLGQYGISLGQSGINLGQSGINLGQSGINLGQSGINLGQCGINLGQSGINLGLSSSSLGLSGNLGSSGSNAYIGNGGGFSVVSYSPIAPSGISVLSENTIEGNLEIIGTLPLLSVASFEGQVPTTGQVGVQYGCGNGDIGITSQNGGSASYGAGSASYGVGTGASYGVTSNSLNAGYSGNAINIGYGAGQANGCGCGCAY